MAPRKITLASPIEPSGASWLVNCFLELGIRVDHKPGAETLWRTHQGSAAVDRMWDRDGGIWRLHPRAAVLGKWLPILVHQDQFRFRDDVFVHYVQEFPGPAQAEETPLLFVRDPRDALYSHYRRRQAALPFPEYIDLPNPVSLMPMADHWLLYIQCWQALVGERLYRFEDYKRDAEALLARILSDLRLDYAAQDIARAVANSSSEAAKRAEALYRARHQGDWEVANRAGKVGDWRARPEIAQGIQAIARRCGTVLSDLGYEVTGPVDDPTPRCVAQLCYLPGFGSVALTPEAATLRERGARTHPSVAETLRIAAQLSEERLKASGYAPADCRRVSRAMQVFAKAHVDDLTRHLEAVDQTFGEGSAQHMDVLRDLMRRRRQARPKP